MADRAVTPWQREAKYQERLQRAHDERRTVRPHFTRTQARNLHEYLSHVLALEPLGRELGAAADELKRAIEAADNGS
jgi:hypothetical protein